MTMQDEFPQDDEHVHGNDAAGQRACPKHDMNMHWADDNAYVDTDRTLYLENAPTFSDMLRVIADTMDNPDMPVYRFSLAFVNAETGNINVISSGGSDTNGAINLLSRAVSIIAFQQQQRDNWAQAQMNRIFKMDINRMYGKPPFPPETPAEKPQDDDPWPGQYL